MIVCETISKSFNNKQILNGVSMEIKNGRITSLIGHNGAGKSTLIGVIAGYYHLDQGSLEKKDLSIMPDADTIYQDMTGKQFLKMMCGIKNCSYEEAKTLAQNLKIEDHLDKKIEGYSFGMKKKISFIQAYIGDFDTYIFDEPTSGVDGPTANLMLKKLEELTDKNAGVLLTSHNLDELERVSDYVYIIESGKIIRQGQVNDIINATQSNDYIEYTIVTSQTITLCDLLNNYLSDFHISQKNNDDKKLLIKVDSTDSLQSILKLAIEHNIPIYEFYQNKKHLHESIYGE